MRARLPLPDAHFLLRDLTALSDALRACASRDAGAGAARAGSHAGEADVGAVFPDIASLLARRARGESYGTIAADLNRRGIRGRCGGRWYPSSVWSMLHR